MVQHNNQKGLTSEMGMKIAGWAVTLSISISGYFLKQMVDKLDMLHQSVHSIEQRILILEERQFNYLKYKNAPMVDNRKSQDNLPVHLTPAFSKSFVKPDEIKVI
jgi:uncharacterized membrane protein